ncbi:MAG: amidohydrolase [Granulosicoccus sp.]|nr:amidohydrolase [Granulosicoccus sp.]
MREANLKFALVSSSDDQGTQLLSDLAPDLIVPGLRPYRRRGELSSWFTDPAALAYVERLLATNRYASIGEFHLYGSDADLEIPRRIVELAEKNNLILHAHSDMEAVERLLAQSSSVKVLWAHSGFDAPEAISAMLSKHDRLWADLAFRSDVGSGGQLSDDWIKLFVEHPDRMMLGTDTYTPERMYFIPEHAEGSRVWLKSLAPEVAEKVAWKNAHDLIMPVWEANRMKTPSDGCRTSIADSAIIVSNSPFVAIEPLRAISVSQPFSVLVTLCGDVGDDLEVILDAAMPAHGHGMNYSPEHTVLEQSDTQMKLQVDGLVLHMPGNWQWQLDLSSAGQRRELTHDFKVQ